MKILLKLLILFFFFSDNQAQWTTKSIGGQTWNVAYALDISSDGILSLFIPTSTFPRKINISLDLGNTWNKYNTGNEFDGTCITSVDSGHIWFTTDDGKIFHSNDSGKTWVLQFHDSSNPYFFDFIKFFNVENGIAVADAISPNSPMTILKTSNGGNNWNIINNSYMIGENAKDVFYQISFPTLLTGFIAGNKSNKLYKTSDGGYNWEEIQLPFFNDFSLVSFYNDKLGFIIGSENLSKIGLYRTTDGGVNWKRIEIVPKTSVCDIEFLPNMPNNIWFSDYDNLYFSADTGDTWSIIKLADSVLGARNIEFLNDFVGFILCDNSKFYSTTNNGGMPTGIEEIGFEFPDKFFLSQNYPNPFNPSTTISFTVPSSSFDSAQDDNSSVMVSRQLTESNHDKVDVTLRQAQSDIHVTLKVYDILGREVATLVNERKPAGVYNVQCIMNNVSSGVYFYTLKAGSFTETKKMLLMK
jgi:photosystem II stability/assembly factor-like uncharacterized protein